jgi:hypothetical protein
MAVRSGSTPLQYAMVGLITGGEVYGALPRAATGRVAEFLNSERGDLMVMTQASSEDVEGGEEVSDLTVALAYVTYVQPLGTADIPVTEFTQQPGRGGTAVELQVVLRTRISIRGALYMPAGLDFMGLISRPSQPFISFARATLSSPDGQSRETDGVLVNKKEIMLIRRISAQFT